MLSFTPSLFPYTTLFRSDAVQERNRKIAEIMSTDRFAGTGTDEPGTGEDIDPGDPWTPPALGGGAGGAAENVAKETEAIRERLLERLEMFREMLASEQELEILKHEQQLEQLQELWEEGIIPTEAEYMEMLEELEARHQDKLTEMQEKGEAERLALIEKAAQMETQARRAALQEAIGFLDQLAGKSKTAALAAIVLNRGLAIAQIIQNTAAAQMRAMAELGPIAGPPAAAKIGVMGKVQAGIAAAAGLAQAAGAMRSGSSLDGGASGSIGGRSSAPSSSAAPVVAADEQRRHTAVTINLQGEVFGRQQVRDLIEQINEATADGAKSRIA